MTILFTVIIGILTLLALGMTLWPLLNRKASEDENAVDYDIAVYKSQLAEIAKDVERGAMTKGDGDAARLEISRRLLKADSQRDEKAIQNKAGWVLNSSRVLIILVIPIVSMGIYMGLGRPGLEDMPLAGRENEIRALVERANQPASVGQGIDDLGQRLAQNPDDLEGWMLMAQSMMAQQRYSDAVMGYRRAIALNKEDPVLHSGLGEAMTMEAEGEVTEDALDAFRTARVLNNQEPRARFFLAQYEYQQGRSAKAIEALQAMARDATEATPWLPSVIGALQNIAIEEGQAHDHYLAGLPMPGTATANGPDPDVVAAAEDAMQGMSDTERTEMIRDMVAGLDARLQEDANDIEGWFRLIRSYVTLGELEAADKAFGQARVAFPQDIPLIIQYARTKRELAGTIQTEQTAQLMQDVLVIDAEHFEANWFAGLWAFKEGDRDLARRHFDTVMAQIEPDSPLYQEITQQLESLFGPTN